MDSRTQVEYDRIKNGPRSGWFTFLHHNGPVVEASDDVMERVEYILGEKPEAEHYTRLRHIHYVPNDMLGTYMETLAPAEKRFARASGATREVLNQAMEEFQEALDRAVAPILTLIPSPQWDGKTILFK